MFWAIPIPRAPTPMAMPSETALPPPVGQVSSVGAVVHDVDLVIDGEELQLEGLGHGH